MRANDAGGAVEVRTGSLEAARGEAFDGIVANMKCTWSPASRSFSATAPLYGTCVTLAPIIVCSSTPERWEEVPTPVEA